MTVGLLSVTDAGFWDPISYFGTSIDTWWDTLDSSKIAVTSNLVTSWTPKVGTRTATPLSTGPTYSASSALVNNSPAILFSNSLSERLSFSATGLPSGTNPCTIVVVAYASADTTSKSVFSYGNGALSGDSRTIGATLTNATSCVTFGLTGSNPVSKNTAWFDQSNIVLGEFFIGPATSLMSVNVNGDPNQSSFPAAISPNTGTTNGRIGCNAADANPWNGAIQGILILNRILTTLEQDKLTSYLGSYYGQSAILSSANPYQSSPPTVRSTATSDLLAGYNSIWVENFNSLSLRTGNVYIDQSSGYVTGKGTWAPSGLNYMTTTKGYPDFGYGQFINPNFNYQAIDPTFPPLGMIDITANGLELNGSEAYPLVRGSFATVGGGQPPFLSALLYAGFSTKVGIPYAVRVNMTVTTNNFEFPAAWSLGSLYNGTVSNITGSISGTTLTVTSPGTIPIGAGLTVGGAGVVSFTQIQSQINGTPNGIGDYVVNHGPQTIASQAMTLTPTHNEIDYFERFGNSFGLTQTNQTTHITASAGLVVAAGGFVLGGSSIFNTNLETLLVRHSDALYLFTNGILTFKVVGPAGFYAQDLDSVILNSGMGMSFEPYPNSFTGSMSGTTMTVTATGNGNRGGLLAGGTVTAPTGVTSSVIQPFGTAGTTGIGNLGTYAMSVSQTVASQTMYANPVSNVPAKLTVRKVEIFAPSSNTNYVLAPTPPVPVITWGGSFTAGAIPVGTTTGTTVATLSGASTYTLLDYNGAAPSHLVISGSNVNTSGSLSAGTFNFYIRGVDAGGVPGIAPKLTAVVS